MVGGQQAAVDHVEETAEEAVGNVRLVFLADRLA